MKITALLTVIVAIVFLTMLAGSGCGRPEDAVDRAWSLYGSGKAFEARDLALKQVTSPPNDRNDRVRLAELLVALSEPGKAAKLIEKERLDPHGRDVLAMAMLRSGRTDEAETTLRALIRDKEESALTRRLLGELHLVGKDFRAARRELGTSLRRDQTDPLTHVYLSQTYRMEGKDQRAEQTLRGAPEEVRDTPELRAALGYLVMSRRGAGQDTSALQEAVDHLRYATERRPLDAGTRSTLGVAYRRLGEFEEAAKVFRALVEDWPKNSEHLSDLGAVLLEMESPQEAVRMLERAMKMGPRRLKTFLNLGNAYLELAAVSDDRANIYERAFGVFDAASKMAPSEALPWVGMARSTVKKNENVALALRYYQMALSRDPNCFEAHLNKALLHYDLWTKDESSRGERWKMALHHFDKAADQTPASEWDLHARQAYEYIEKTRPK